MKIGAVYETIRSLETVRDRQEGGSRQQQHQQQGSKKKEEETPQFEVTEQKVTEAMASFQSEVEGRANGLSASMSGRGPGLRVVLKDGTGAVVRQFTGEEFLKMREAAGRDNHGRGKILDQKL